MDAQATAAASEDYPDDFEAETKAPPPPPPPPPAPPTELPTHVEATAPSASVSASATTHVETVTAPTVAIPPATKPVVFAGTLLVPKRVVSDAKSSAPQPPTELTERTESSRRRSVDFAALQLMKKAAYDAQSSAATRAAPDSKPIKTLSRCQATNGAASTTMAAPPQVTTETLAGLSCVGPAAKVEAFLADLSAEAREAQLRLPTRVRVDGSAFGLCLTRSGGRKIYALGHGFAAPPLHFAVVMDRIDVVVALLQAGAPVGIRPEPRLPTALEVAELNGLLDVATLLKLHEAQLNRASERKKSLKRNKTQPATTSAQP